MNIRFHSTVLITRRLEAMKDFYIRLLGQGVRFDFGSCITLESALTLWEPRVEYVLSKALEGKFGANSGLEVCFETENFDAEAARIKASGVALLHDIEEEAWGQRTLRFFDPDGNIVELGESIPCFCRRMSASGLSDAEVAKKTGVSEEAVAQHLKNIHI
jgi:catechol 2,3-dioxygenase-like lactoylglutathione lyase family enzyme